MQRTVDKYVFGIEEPKYPSIAQIEISFIFKQRYVREIVNWLLSKDTYSVFEEGQFIQRWHTGAEIGLSSFFLFVVANFVSKCQQWNEVEKLKEKTWTLLTLNAIEISTVEITWSKFIAINSISKHSVRIFIKQNNIRLQWHSNT